jgi:transferase CAF17, mitochondrial
MPTPNVSFYRPPPLYAALLTPQGRFLYDFFLCRPPSLEGKLDRSGSGPMKEESNDDVTLLADVDADFFDEILSTFKR